VNFRYLAGFLLLVSGWVQAFDFGDGVIEIPAGFEGPITQNIRQGASATAFIFPHDKHGNTLLQINTWNPGKKLPGMTQEELKTGSQKCVLKFLSGIERRRDNFQREQVQFIKISGHPVAKVNWRGMVQGKKVHGTMYCLIYNSKLLSFHTQDFSIFKGKYTSKAIHAFESIKFKK